MCKCNPLGIKANYCGEGVCVAPEVVETVSVSKEALENFQSTMWLARTFIPDSANGGSQLIESLERQCEIIKKLLKN